MDLDRHGLLTKLGFAALTCNSGLAIYRSRGDPATVAFVAAAYAAIALLFHFLRGFDERAADNRGIRTTNKAAVWALTTLLTGMFAARVAPLMPTPVVEFLVWTMAAATAAAGFWALFLASLAGHTAAHGM